MLCYTPVATMKAVWRRETYVQTVGPTARN